MKIKITYELHEKKQAERLAELFRNALERDAVVKEKHSDKYKPYYHIYLSSRNNSDL